MPPEMFEDKLYSLPDELLRPASEDTTTPEELEANNLSPAFEMAEKQARKE